MRLSLYSLFIISELCPGVLFKFSFFSYLLDRLWVVGINKKSVVQSMCVALMKLRRLSNEQIWRCLQLLYIEEEICCNKVRIWSFRLLRTFWHTEQNRWDPLSMYSLLSGQCSCMTFATYLKSLTDLF